MYRKHDLFLSSVYFLFALHVFANKYCKTMPCINRKNNNDNIDNLCRSITNKLSDAVKKYCSAWHTAHNISSERVGQIMFYHEAMWDLLDILESKGMIAMPAILKGEEVGKQHFGDICFIVIDDSEQE